MKTIKLFRTFTEKNHYELLGVSPTSNLSEIKAAYLRLAKKFHPDSQEGDEEMFKQLSTAYQILKNEEQRNLYDKAFKKTAEKQQQTKETKKTSYSAHSFSKVFKEEVKGNKWSGGGFTTSKPSEQSDPNIKPSDVFVNMGKYAIGAAGVMLILYIGFLIVMPVSERGKVERPEGIVTRPPERRPVN